MEHALRKGIEPVNEVEESRNRSNASASFGGGPEMVIAWSERNIFCTHCSLVIILSKIVVVKNALLYTNMCLILFG